jgi:hypothetical protein
MSWKSQKKSREKLAEAQRFMKIEDYELSSVVIDLVTRLRFLLGKIMTLNQGMV